MKRVFVSYKRESDVAAGLDSEGLADKVCARLLSAGYQVFQDKKVQPGNFWNTDINNNLAACDGAIALLSPAALDSEWVRHELSVLSHRRQTGNPPICLLIALVSGLSIEELGARTKAQSLSSLQAFMAAPNRPGYVLAANDYTDEEHMLTRVVATITTELPKLTSPRERLLQKLARILEAYPDQVDDLEARLQTQQGSSELRSRLWRMAEALLKLPPRWPELLIALQILHAGEPANQNKLEQLLRLVFPFWIGESANATFSLAKALDTFPVVTADNDEIVHDYVRRAELMPSYWEALPLMTEGTERDDGPFEQLVSMLRDRYLRDSIAEIQDGDVGLNVLFPIVRTPAEATRVLNENRHWLRPVLKSRTANGSGVVLEPSLSSKEEADLLNAYKRLANVLQFKVNLRKVST